MANYKFDCGCEVPQLGNTIKAYDGLPPLEIPYEDIEIKLNYKIWCPETWNLLSKGYTRGIWQLESYLGRSWSKKLQPSSMEEICALIALIRPGCISKDTLITVSSYIHTDGNRRFKRISMEQLYKNKDKYPYILSVNETTGNFVQNIVDDVFYTGKKECFKVKIRKYSSSKKSSKLDCPAWYDLECTDDHKIFTPNGWVQLKDLSIGDRIAVSKRVGGQKLRKEKVSSRHHASIIINNTAGLRYFSEVCYKTYLQECAICGWKESTLDVHHVNGNRHTDNSPENLCYLCPNHHRMVNNGVISQSDIVLARDGKKLPHVIDIEWVTYLGKESVGVKDVYDITMSAPHHNFIAGNFIVHNCLKAFQEMPSGKPKSMTQLYVDRKHGVEPNVATFKVLDEILSPTYQVLTYQEQSMRIATVIAGFNEQEADMLRKAIGKKKPELMAKVKGAFLEGCKKVGLVTEDEAKEIFDWIEKSNRYSFNKSHSYAYGELGYISGFVKQHFPLHFFCSWLSYARAKPDTQDELRQLVAESKLMNISVKPPSIGVLFENNGDVCIKNDEVHIGVKCIKGIGEASINNMIKAVVQIEKLVGKPIHAWSWTEFLRYLAGQLNKTVVNNLICSGVFSHLGISRQRMLHEYNIYKQLTKREQDCVCRMTLPNLKECIKALIVTPRAAGGPASKDRVEKLSETYKGMQDPAYTLQDTPRWILTQEKELFGTPLTYSVVDTISHNFEPNSTCDEFEKGKRASEMSFAVEITEVREWTIKTSGDVMAFVTVEDISGKMDCVAFKDVWEEEQHILTEGNTVAIIGERSKRGSLMIKKVFQI